ncbi:enoyl-CoA hydratase/isomerase family protein [Streptomyces sp. CA-111067]|uniref:enoyl-CoA hydratase/isomerase family protein n=1 Tax=Streptomyces sp. CA-111067 TaxID=3240046 RepID=UPI003D99D755
MFTDFPPSPFKTLRIRQDPDVLRIELFRPDSGNAVTAEMLDELLGVLTEIPDRPDVRVLVLSGAGDDFSLGADVKELRELLQHDLGGRSTRTVLDKGGRVCDALENLPVVTVARLHGRVTGAGLALAVSCDLRVAADTTRFRMPELAFNLVPAWGGGLGRLIAAVGEAAVRELVLTSAEFDAPYARDLGLIQRVEQNGDLDAVIEQAWIKPLLRRSPEAVALTKRLFAVHTRSSRGADTALLDADLLTAQLRRTAEAPEAKRQGGGFWGRARTGRPV